MPPASVLQGAARHTITNGHRMRWPVRAGSQSGVADWAINYSVYSQKQAAMSALASNVVEFPLERCRNVGACPHCGTYSDVRRVGRLLWAYCDAHEVRWVVADDQSMVPGKLDRHRLRKVVEFLSSFAEVSFRN